MIIDAGTKTWRTLLPAGFAIVLALLGLVVALGGCTGCNHPWPDKDQICGPYSSFFWFPK